MAPTNDHLESNHYHSPYSLAPFEPAIKSRSVTFIQRGEENPRGEKTDDELTLAAHFFALVYVALPPTINRTEKFKQWIDTINRTEGGYEQFSRGYESFGLHALPNGDVRYREWAPNAVTASLTGDFSEPHSFSIYPQVEGQSR